MAEPYHLVHLRLPLQIGISHRVYQQLIEIFNLKLMLLQLHLLPPLVLL